MTTAPGDAWYDQADPESRLAAYLRRSGNAYNRTKTELLMRWVEKNLDGKTVLDYGGGGGYMTVLFARRGATVTLVDENAAALEVARDLIRKSGVSDRIEILQSGQLPKELKGRRFDIVVLKDLLEHVEPDEELLREVAALQEPGGQLLISTQNSVSLNYVLESAYQRRLQGNPTWMGWDRQHVRFYTPWSLHKRLRGAGYRRLRWASLYLIPYDILSWLTLRRRIISLPFLRWIDRTVGLLPGFNRLGWNLVVTCFLGSV